VEASIKVEITPPCTVPLGKVALFGLQADIGTPLSGARHLGPYQLRKASVVFSRGGHLPPCPHLVVPKPSKGNCLLDADSYDTYARKDDYRTA
jgi:hypothetical protein